MVTETTGSSRTGRRWQFAALVFFGFLFFLEGGLRVVGLAVEQVQRGRRAAVKGNSGPVVWTVGDSVTQGVPEGLPHGWPPRFAARTGSTVHNFGSAGRDVAWMVADLDRRMPDLPDHPDWIIAMIGHNDCSYLEDLASIHMPDPPSQLERVRKQLRSLVTYRVLLQVVARLRPAPTGQVTQMKRPVDGARESAYCRARVSTGLEALQVRAARIGTRLVVATYPVPDRKDTPGLRVNRFLDTLLEEGAHARGLPFVDTRPCFARAPQSDWQQDGVHLTRSGYARLGDCIAEGYAWAP